MDSVIETMTSSVKNVNDCESVSSSESSCQQTNIARDKTRHDIHASLAIVKGFNQALETSFVELCETYQGVCDANAGVLQEEKASQLAALEADCRFCLSRITRSLEQLGVRIDAHDDACKTTDNEYPQGVG